MLNSLSPRATALLIGLLALATLVGAWIFEYAGYLPCELCLLQRWAYYTAIPLSLMLVLWNPRWISWGLLLLALIWLGSAVFGAYHAGVEWGWWQGPTACSGGGDSLGTGDGLPNLSQPGVMCNEAAIRILGLSLAGWNAVISLVLAILAFRAFRK